MRKERKGMACEHKRIMSRNCVLYCADCGAVIDPPKAEKPLEGAAEAVTEAKEKKPLEGAAEAVTEAKEKKPRRTRKSKAD